MATATAQLSERLHGLCRQHVTSDVLSYFEQLVSAEPARELALLGGFSAAARRAGKEPISLPDELLHDLATSGLTLPAPITRATLVRSWLLSALCLRLPESAHVGIVKRAFQTGDNDERCVVLRMLPVLPAPERFAMLAVEACRTNVLDVFQALACDNPYPAAHFGDESFNQLVMKALFMGSPLARLHKLETRINSELVRMVRDYAAERRAAHRPIPTDCRLIDSTLEMDA